MEAMKPGYPSRNTRSAGCLRFMGAGTDAGTDAGTGAGTGAATGAAGFTLVELIAVIILLSILGVVAMGRMGSPRMFAPAIVTQSLIAEVRLAQQLATSRHDATLSLIVDRVGGQWRLRTLSSVDGLLRSETFDADGTTIAASSGAASGAVDVASALTVVFDHSGDLAAVAIGGSPGDPGAGVDVTVTGDNTRRICIYPSGYANESACG